MEDQAQIVILSERNSQRYENITFQRQGWVGRNKETGVTEVLPINAFEIVPMRQFIAPIVEQEARRLLMGLLAEAGVAVPVEEEEDAKDPGESEA